LVVLEAMARGLAVVALKLGGPATMVTEECGRLIDVEGRNADEVVQALGAEIVALERDEDLRARLAAGAIERARQYSWSGMAAAAYAQIESRLAEDKPAQVGSVHATAGRPLGSKAA
jgi:glycosyltransferase involved in cell wall biosynthesis